MSEEYPGDEPGTATPAWAATPTMPWARVPAQRPADTDPRGIPPVPPDGPPPARGAARPTTYGGGTYQGGQPDGYPQRPEQIPSQRDPRQAQRPYGPGDDPGYRGEPPAGYPPRGQTYGGPDRRGTDNHTYGGPDRRGTDDYYSPPRPGGPQDPRGGDSRGGDPRGGDSSGGDPRGGDPRGGDPRGGDPRGGDPRGGDLRSGDPRGGDSWGGDSWGGDRRGVDPRGGDVRGGDPRGDLRGDSWGVDPRGTDPRGGDVRGGDPRGSDPRGGDFRGADPRGGNLRGGDPRAVDQRGPDQRGPDSRGLDQRGPDPRFDPRGSDSWGPGVDPRGADPRGVDPRGSDPRYADPRYTDPRYSDPRYSDPRQDDQRYGDPRYHDPRQDDPRAYERGRQGYPDGSGRPQGYGQRPGPQPPHQGQPPHQPQGQGMRPGQPPYADHGPRAPQRPGAVYGAPPPGAEDPRTIPRADAFTSGQVDASPPVSPAVGGPFTPAQAFSGPTHSADPGQPADFGRPGHGAPPQYGTQIGPPPSPQQTTSGSHEHLAPGSDPTGPATPDDHDPGSHQAGPSAHQPAPTSHQAGPSDHQPSPTAHHAAPGSHHAAPDVDRGAAPTSYPSAPHGHHATPGTSETAPVSAVPYNQPHHAAPTDGTSDATGDQTSYPVDAAGEGYARLAPLNLTGGQDAHPASDLLFGPAVPGDSSTVPPTPSGAFPLVADQPFGPAAPSGAFPLVTSALTTPSGALPQVAEPTPEKPSDAAPESTKNPKTTEPVEDIEPSSAGPEKRDDPLDPATPIELNEGLDLFGKRGGSGGYPLVGESILDGGTFAAQPAPPVHLEEAHGADGPQPLPPALSRAGVDGLQATGYLPIVRPGPGGFPAELAALVPPDVEPAVEPTKPDAKDAKGPDPEQILAGYTWRFDPDTLREQIEGDEVAELQEIRDLLTAKLNNVEDNPSRARLLSLRAVVSRILNDLPKAFADGKLALAHAEATGELRRIAIAQARLAHVLQWREEFEEADRLFTQANSPELPDRLRATMHQHTGKCAYDQGRYMEACNHFERALDLRKEEDPELIAQTELALDAVFRRVAEKGWGPYPRSREDILQIRKPPAPAFDETSQRWGFVTGDGEFCIGPGYVDVQPFRDGVAWVQRQGAQTWELIDDSGRSLIDAAAGYLGVSSFSDGLAWVSRDGTTRWIAIDKNNTVLISTGFEDVRPFRRGVAAVRRNNRWGAVDGVGRMVVPFQFDGFATALHDGRFIDGFNDEGLAVVSLSGRKGVVDRSGRVIVPPVHHVLMVHPVAFLVADESQRWGALDRRGRLVIDLTFPSRLGVIDEIDRLLADTRPVM